MEIKGFEAHSGPISLRIPSLIVGRGSFCALVAKSGAGKSVLLSVLTGHLLGPWMRKKDAIRFDQFRIGNTQVHPKTFAFPGKLRAVLRGENLIYLPQKFPEDRSMKRRCLSEMADVVGAIALNCPRKTAKAELTESCRKLNLHNVLEQPLKDLSGGERKRVEIIARLCGVELQNPSEKSGGVVFLLDEPTTGLDIAAQRQYFLFLKKTKELFPDINITFVTATHALSLLEEDETIFDTVLYVEKEEGSAGEKHCKLAYCGSANTFARTEFFAELNGRATPISGSIASEQIEVAPSVHTANAQGDTDSLQTRSRSKISDFISSFDEELRRANGKQFEGKGKSMVFVVPFLVGLIVFAAFLAREEINPERFVFFSTIYAFWIGIFNSCQIVNGAVASGEWNYWVLALRRPFFGYLLANTLVAFFLSLVQIAVFAGGVLLFSFVWQENSLFNVFVTQSQLPTFFIEDVSGISANVVISVLFFTSLVMGGLAGVGLGSLISCVAKDTLGALKIAVGVLVVSMVSSTTVLKSDGRSFPVTPPLFLKLACPAPFLSSPATISSEKPNAGGWPHLLEDASMILPQRYFFNIGRVLDKDVLEFSESYHRKNEDFEYKLPAALADNWKFWKRVTNENTLDDVRAELSEKGRSLEETKFSPTILKIIGLEVLACSLLSALFFFAGVWITIKNKGNYEIH